MEPGTDGAGEDGAEESETSVFLHDKMQGWTEGETWICCLCYDVFQKVKT